MPMKDPADLMVAQEERAEVNKWLRLFKAEPDYLGRINLLRKMLKWASEDDSRLPIVHKVMRLGYLTDECKHILGQIQAQQLRRPKSA